MSSIAGPKDARNASNNVAQYVAAHPTLKIAPGIADAQVVELEGGDVTSLPHRGPYEELAVAYHTLYAWVREHGHDEAGLVREVYHNDPANVAASELLTELVLPIR